MKSFSFEMKSPGFVVLRKLRFLEGKFSLLIFSVLVNEIYVFLMPLGSVLGSSVEESTCYRLEGLINVPCRDLQRMT